MDELRSTPSRRGKRIALLAALVALLGGALAAYVGRERLVENWYLYRLGSSDPETSAHAIAALRGLRSRRVVRPLLETARGPLERINTARQTGDSDVDATLPPAGQALVGMGGVAAPVLADVVRDAQEDRGLRRSAVRLLGEIGAAARSEMDALVEHSDPQVCMYGFWALSVHFESVDVDDAWIVAAVVRALRHEHREIRRFAYRVLARDADGSLEALRELLKGLDDPVARVREAAAEFFARRVSVARGDQFDVLLAHAATDAEPAVCVRLLAVLRDVNRSTEQRYRVAPPLVRALLEHPDDAVRPEAAMYAAEFPEVPRPPVREPVGPFR